MSSSDMCDFLAGLRSQITRLADGGRATIGMATELHELADAITDQMKVTPIGNRRLIIDKLAVPDLAKRCLLRAAVATTQSERDDWTEAATQLSPLPDLPERPSWIGLRPEALALFDIVLRGVIESGPLPRSTSAQLIEKIIKATEPLPAASNASHHSG
jgi:hypothetical protein